MIYIIYKIILTSGQQLVMQELNLEPVLFTIFLGNLGDVAACSQQVVDGARLEGLAGTPHGGASAHRDMETLEDEASRYLLQLGNEEYERCIWGGTTPCLIES